ncbi:hypothetical protein JCM9534A_16040 [Catenuloplanes indicus JCM 9534]|uniref:NADPH:quinone reductase-like Zn-dependent oxidoreductase n=1 Tax=Catenuloplanes indicus TaxID=137267 RepID=A0AAE4AWQ3_9ACTN|nr:NADPH:quinone reductase-like Zn-dependent oxidoreductase [Catenuloplanes indicus]
MAVSPGVPPDRINTTADGNGVRRYGVRSAAQAQADTPEIGERIAGLAAAGRIVIPIARAYPLDRVQDAYRDLGTRHVRGKRVLHVMSPQRRSALPAT